MWYDIEVFLTGPQIRAARGLVGWSQTDLAFAAGIGLATVQRLERQDGMLRGITDTIWKIRKALEEAGIIFIEGDDSTGPGVRLSKPISDNG